jgi:ribosome-binding protein aMBF1 (putative translation factor)
MPKAKFSPPYDRCRALLVTARQSAGLKQTDLTVRLGRHQSYVSKVEQAERRLDVVEFLEFTREIGAHAVKMFRKAIETEARWCCQVNPLKTR